MTGRPTKSLRKSANNRRLRAGFLAQAGAQIEEFSALLADDDDMDTRDSIGHQLGRMANTARALNFEDLAVHAQTAAKQLDNGTADLSLRMVAKAIRASMEAPRFGPVAIVASGALAEMLTSAAATTSEPVHIVESADELFKKLTVEPYTAIAFPSGSLDSVQKVVAEETFPVLVYGDPNNWKVRLAAVEAGSVGFLALPFELSELLELARWHLERSRQEPAEVFILANDDKHRRKLVSHLKSNGIPSMASANPAEIMPALDVVCPDALIIGERVGGKGAEVLIRAVRAHSHRGHVPLLVVGDPGDPEALLTAGADDVMSSTATPKAIESRLRARLTRFDRVRRERHLVSGLPSRMGVLRDLDRHIANARRADQTLSVALVQVDGLIQARARWGKSAANAAQRLMATCLEGGLRRVDIVGQLGTDFFIAALPSCRISEARKRLREISRRFLSRCRGDHRLKALEFRVGLADTEGGIERLLLRADEDLHAGGKI